MQSDIEKILNDKIEEVKVAYKKKRKTVKNRVNFLCRLSYAEKGGLKAKISFLERCGIDVKLSAEFSNCEQFNFEGDDEEK